MKLELLTVCDAQIGCAVGCSRRGASHVRSNKPCQDAYAVCSAAMAGQPLLVTAVVADGHGDERHDLSQHGAAVAVKIATEEATAFATHFGATAATSAWLMNFRADYPRRVVRRWREAVTDDARERLGDTVVADSTTLLTRYGTTLLTALVLKDFLLIGQLGDGDILLVQPDGQLECPIPAHLDDVAGATNSLGSTDSQRLWRTASWPFTSGALLLLSTDGLSNSFDGDDQFHAFARSLAQRVAEYGLFKVAESLPGWLDTFSDRGSGDDITLALVALT